jgi:hypothetical protein
MPGRKHIDPSRLGRFSVFGRLQHGDALLKLSMRDAHLFQITG